MPLDQREAPMIDELARGRGDHRYGFGAPGHNLGRGAGADVRRTLGRSVFRADLATPKGLDDRTERRQTVQRAHAIAAEAWGASMCRFTSCGSTQSLHIALAALARPGNRIVLARNAHKVEFAAAVFMGLGIVPLDVAIDPDWDVEHTPNAEMLEAALDGAPNAKAVVIVSPTYFGVTADVPALARIAHARGIPLVVDAAWGAAYGFSSRLPPNPLAGGADVMVTSVHKTMAALGAGSALLARDGLVDTRRIALAYELLLTTSPSVPILASIDAARREHVLHGETIWAEAIDFADAVRVGLAAIDGVRVLEPDALHGPGIAAIDRTKIVFDVAGFGIAGYAADDWLVVHRRVSVALSDGARLVAVIGGGTSARDGRRLVAAVRALARHCRRHPGASSVMPDAAPGLAELTCEIAMPASAAFHAVAKAVPLEEAAGRIAAEFIAPAPPGIPRLISGQRITDAHIRFLLANRDAGMFVLDPADDTQRTILVVDQVASG